VSGAHGAENLEYVPPVWHAFLSGNIDRTRDHDGLHEEQFGTCTSGSNLDSRIVAQRTSRYDAASA